MGAASRDPLCEEERGMNFRSVLRSVDHSLLVLGIPTVCVCVYVVSPCLGRFGFVMAQYCAVSCISARIRPSRIESVSFPGLKRACIGEKREYLITGLLRRNPLKIK